MTFASTATEDQLGADPLGNRIVVGVDSSSPARHALRWALAEAQRRQVGCRVIEVWNPSTIDTLDPRPERHHIDERQADAQTALSALVEDVLVDIVAIPAPKVEVLRGDPVEVLGEAALQADLLVVGSQRHGMINHFLGSVSTALLHRGVCPMVVVPPDADTHGQHGRVVVGVDGSEGATRALDWAHDEAGRRHADLVVVHAWHIPAVMGSPFAPGIAIPFDDCESAASEILARAVSRLQSGADVAVFPSLVQGLADAELTQAGIDADLIVVGRGHSGLAAAVLGSTSRGCVHRSPCAVAVIP